MMVTRVHRFDYFIFYNFFKIFWIRIRFLSIRNKCLGKKLAVIVEEDDSRSDNTRKESIAAENSSDQINLSKDEKQSLFTLFGHIFVDVICIHRLSKRISLDTTYTISVLTGNRWAAEMDKDLYVELYGEYARSGRHTLRQDVCFKKSSFCFFFFPLSFSIFVR